MNTLRKHKLLTKDIEAKLPKAYSTDGQGDEAVAIIKFFSPYNGWEWYATEYNAEDRIFFGLVKGFETELGYFSLDELEEAEISFGGVAVPAVERDLHFSPKPLSAIR